MKRRLVRLYYFFRYKAACLISGRDDVLRARISSGKPIIFVNDLYIQFDDLSFVLRDNKNFSIEEMEKFANQLKKLTATTGGKR